MNENYLNEYLELRRRVERFALRCGLPKAKLIDMAPPETMTWLEQTVLGASVGNEADVPRLPFFGLEVRRLNPRAQLPRYMTEGAAGMDLTACLASDKSTGDMILRPGERRVIPSGIAVSIPAGFEGQVRGRSGLAREKGLTVLNSPGTIDSDYRGELGALLINHGSQSVTIRHGDRIAQLVIIPVARVEIREMPALSKTQRGEGGFGSTGFTSFKRMEDAIHEAAMGPFERLDASAPAGVMVNEVLVPFAPGTDPAAVPASYGDTIQAELERQAEAQRRGQVRLDKAGPGDARCPGCDRKIVDCGGEMPTAIIHRNTWVCSSCFDSHIWPPEQ